MLHVYYMTGSCSEDSEARRTMYGVFKNKKYCQLRWLAAAHRHGVVTKEWYSKFDINVLIIPVNSYSYHKDVYADPMLAVIFLNHRYRPACQ